MGLGEVTSNLSTIPYYNVDDQVISEHVKDGPQHYSPENSLTPLSPTVTYSPDLDESQQPDSDGGKLA